MPSNLEGDAYLESILPGFSSQIEQEGQQQQAQVDEDSAYLENMFPELKGMSAQEFKPPSKPQESWFDSTVRNIAGGAQSIASVLGGLPASMIGGAGTLAGKLLSKAHAYTTTRPEGMSPEEWEKVSSKPAFDPSMYDLGIPEIVPDVTISGLKKHIATAGTWAGISPDYWEPKTPGEETARDYIESVTSLLHPYMWPVGIGKAVLAPIIGAGGKKAAEALGLGKVGQEITGAVGESLFLGWNPKKIEEKMGSLFDKAGRALESPNVKVFAVNGKPIRDHVANLKPYLGSRFDPSKAEQWILKRTDGMQNLLNKQRVDVSRLWDYKKSFAKHVGEYTGDMKGIEPFVKKTNDILDKMITSYGAKYNKPFLNAYKDANSIFNGLNDTPKYFKTLNKALAKRGDTVSILLATGALTLGTAGKGLVALKLFKNASEAVNALKKSSAIRKYFAKGVAAATKQQAKKAASYFEQADKSLEKKFPGILNALREEHTKNDKE
jgi:hypothetical protein